MTTQRFCLRFLFSLGNRPHFHGFGFARRSDADVSGLGRSRLHGYCLKRTHHSVPRIAFPASFQPIARSSTDARRNRSTHQPEAVRCEASSEASQRNARSYLLAFANAS